MTLPVHAIWWRAVQLGEFFNIERAPGGIAGGGGARYIEIPASLVPHTYRFLGVAWVPGQPLVERTITARTVGAPAVLGSLEFKIKTGGRLRIANQNRQATPHLRHPAWRADRGFPQAPDDVARSTEAAAYYPKGGLRIYLVRTRDGDFYAGFTTGPTPPLPVGHPTRLLYGRGPGGLVEVRT